MAKVKILTRDAITASGGTSLKCWVEVPEWGGCIYVRTLTGTERDAFESSVVNR